MKKLQTILMLTAMVFGITIATAWANTPNEISDWIKVSFDKPVHIDGRTLQPGNYVLEQLPSAQASQDRGTFQIWHNGERIAVTTPVKYALDKTATQTRATVAVVNGERHLHRVNVAGSSYGWDFLAADTARAFRSAQQQKQNMTEENAVAYTLRPQDSQSAQQASTENSGASGQQNNAGNSATATNDQGTSATGNSVSANSTHSNSGVSSQEQNATQSQNPDQLVQVLGCVSDSNGDSYLLTKDGQKYHLRGDADGIREYAGKIVTVGGIVNPNTDRFHPMFLTVRELAPTAELCDTPTSGATNNSSASANSNNANTGNANSQGSSSSSSEAQNMNASSSTGGSSTTQPSSVGSSTGSTTAPGSAGTTTGTTPPQR